MFFCPRRLQRLRFNNEPRNSGSKMSTKQPHKSDIVVSEFNFKSCYYIGFRANTLGKGMNLLIPPAMG